MTEDIIRKYRKMKSKLLFSIVVFSIACGLLLSGCALRSEPIGWSGATVTDNAIFIASAEGNLVGLSKSDGQPLWPAYSIESSEGKVAVYGNPAIYEDLLYVASYDGRIYTVSISSGYRGLIFPGQGSLEPIVGGLAIFDGKIYFGCDDGKIYALTAEDLLEQWTFQTGDKIWSMPAVDEDAIYASSFDNKVYAIDRVHGNEKWHFEADGAFVSTPLIYDDIVYAGCFDRHIYAINATNGNLKWRSEVEADKWFWAQPLLYNNIIYAPNLDGMIYILDAENGREAAQPVQLDSPISSSPVLVNERVIIASQQGQIYSIDTSSNRVSAPLYRVDEDEEIRAPLSSSEGVVYIHAQASKEDTLYAVDIENRQEVWAPIPLS